VGRQGPALRDQEHRAAPGHPGCHGEADARRARETLRHPHLRRPARRRHQYGRRREAAGDQGLGSVAPAADQRSRGPGRGHPRGGDGNGSGHSGGRRRHQTGGRAGRRAAARRRAVRRPVRQPGADDQRGGRPRQYQRRVGDDCRRDAGVRVDIRQAPVSNGRWAAALPSATVCGTSPACR